MRLCVDSSALAKRYVLEPGTETVRNRCAAADEILISVVCAPEVISGLNRILREGGIDRSTYDLLRKELEEDIAEAVIVDLSPEIVRETVRCLESAVLRTLDAIHVATAIAGRVNLFLSADHQQCRAAKSLGLNVEEVR